MEENIFMQPLAARMRPRKLEEFVGQQETAGEKSWLRQAILSGNIPSLLFFGPPGSGKTTLAEVIAQEIKANFVRLNATTASVADIRRVAAMARESWQAIDPQKTLLFIDEIHRFNKSQQDALLPIVENGLVNLIGATTENPFFSVNGPLLSRLRLIRLRALNVDELQEIISRALGDKDRGLAAWWQGEISAEALTLIADLSAGDARVALNILEQAVYYAEQNQQSISNDTIAAVTGEKLRAYDRRGDNHYDVISAFIKSMRGSDPDAVAHYLARMLDSGEDIKFIARRIIICASEDVGNADPQALQIATAAMQAVHFVGMPEARIILSQAAIYVACAPKSNAAYMAIEQALADVANKNCGAVPIHLRDSSYRGATKLGHGEGYKYPHDYPYGHIAQQYLPDNLLGVEYYRPTRFGQEKTISERMMFWRNKGEGNKNGKTD